MRAFRKPDMTTDATCVRRYSFAALLALVVTLAPAAQLAAAHGLAAEASPAEALEVLSGTVNTVAIEDRIQHTNFNYRELRLDDGTIIPLYGQASENLQHGARVRVAGRRMGTPLEAAAVEVLAAPSPSDPGAETAVEVTGTLAIAHGDDFVAGKSEYVYEVPPTAATPRASVQRYRKSSKRGDNRPHPPGGGCRCATDEGRPSQAKRPTQGGPFCLEGA